MVLEGAFNMRDLGDVPTTEGVTVRTGRLFRSDALDEQFGSPVAWLQRHGLQDSAIESLRRELLA